MMELRLNQDKLLTSQQLRNANFGLATGSRSKVQAITSEVEEPVLSAWIRREKSIVEKVVGEVQSIQNVHH